MTLTAELHANAALEAIWSIPKLAQRAIDLAWSRNARLAVAESCTAGAVAAALAMTDGASACFQGGVVAYSPLAKYEMLGVTPGPVIGHEPARQMARGALERFDADVAVATTGVLGPIRQEGQAVGTLWLGGCSRRQPALAVRKAVPRAEPGGRRDGAVREALRLLIMLLEQ
ncbi:MAG: CinA family protein [Acidimicrobiia bacterium]